MTVERLEWALTEANELLSELPILAPDPSQDTQDRYYAVNSLIEDIVDQATTKGYAHTQLTNRSDRPAPAPPINRTPTPQPEPPTNSQEPLVVDKDSKIDAIVKTLLKQEGNRPLSPAHVFELLTTQPTKVRRQQELAGMGRILGGVEWADEDDWRSVFNELSIEDPTTSYEHCRLSTLCDRVIDVNQRLHNRHELIDVYTQSATSQRIIHTILIKVDWIRFAEDYNSLRGVQKTAWLVSGFQRANPQIFADLDDQDTRKKLKEHGEELLAWKRKVGKDTTCRNRLYELFIEYGAIIILDPIWNIQALRDHSGAAVHQAFLRVPARIPRPFDPDHQLHHPLSVLQPAIEQALLSIVDTVAGPNASRYVNDFLDDFMGQVKIPRLEDYD